MFSISYWSTLKASTPHDSGSLQGICSRTLETGATSTECKVNKRIVVVVLAVLMAAVAYPQTTDLITLARNGAPRDLQTAISKGGDVNTLGEDNWTLLMAASQSNPDPEVITLLVKNGAKVEAIDDWRHMTALMIAAQFNSNAKVISALVKAGASLKAVDKSGRTALTYAAQYSQNPEVISALLKAGADLEFSDSDGQNALMYAAQYNKNTEVISALLNAGARKEARDKTGSTSIILAAKKNQNPDVIVRLLNAGANAKAKNKLGDMALDYAQYNSSLKGTDALKKLEEASK